MDRTFESLLILQASITRPSAVISYWFTELVVHTFGSFSLWNTLIMLNFLFCQVAAEIRS
jgi:hypothetical protein